MGRFFKTTPKKGMPISTPGFAEGLAKMERCLEKLDIAGGYPDWQNDVLLLVPASGATGETGATGPEKPHNELAGLYGGNPYIHLTQAEYEELFPTGGGGEDPPDLPDPEVPPCGHPGNLPGGGPGGDDEHPGDLPGGGPGGDDEHPGDSPSPPSSGECP